MINNKFELRFASELTVVNEIVKDILTFIDKAIPFLTSDERFDIRLIFSELLCNAVIHGNKHDKQKQVYLSVEVHDDAIQSTITDEGLGFDYEKLIASFEITDEMNDLAMFESENGRGIRLAYTLTDDFSYNAHGNEIYFYKRVTSNG